MKKTLILLLLACFLIGCHKTGWKAIDIGRYRLDVPDDFMLKFERGIDSNPGYLAGNGLKLYFDYGAYSDTLISTRREYIRKGWWKEEAIIRYINSGTYHDVDDRETKVLSTRSCTVADSAIAKGCDLMAACAFKNYRFNLPIFIPQEIKDHVVIIDTIQHQYRRLVYPHKGKKGTTGIYMRDERGSVYNGNEYPELVISADNLNEKQQALVLKILETLRPGKTQ